MKNLYKTPFEHGEHEKSTPGNIWGREGAEKRILKVHFLTSNKIDVL